jgi:ABC-type nitrate/sulfonate/bicarbonate transport system permease component
MFRGIVVLALIVGVLLVWFGRAGQSMQSLEVAFVLGLIIGVLFGLWLGGGRILRKIREDDIQNARARYDRNKANYL